MAEGPQAPKVSIATGAKVRAFWAFFYYYFYYCYDNRLKVKYKKQNAIKFNSLLVLLSSEDLENKK
jgi:hypothetical protein